MENIFLYEEFLNEAKKRKKSKKKKSTTKRRSPRNIMNYMRFGGMGYYGGVDHHDLGDFGGDGGDFGGDGGGDGGGGGE